MKCKNCKYYENEFCKRFPRKPIFTENNDSYKVCHEYPLQKEDDWCGEYKKK